MKKYNFPSQRKVDMNEISSVKVKKERPLLTAVLTLGVILVLLAFSFV